MAIPGARACGAPTAIATTATLIAEHDPFLYEAFHSSPPRLLFRRSAGLRLRTRPSSRGAGATALALAAGTAAFVILAAGNAARRGALAWPGADAEVLFRLGDDEGKEPVVIGYEQGLQHLRPDYAHPADVPGLADGPRQPTTPLWLGDIADRNSAMSGGVVKVRSPSSWAAGPNPDSRNRSNAARDSQKSPSSLRRPARRVENQPRRGILIDPHMGVRRPVLLLRAVG